MPPTRSSRRWSKPAAVQERWKPRWIMGALHSGAQRSTAGRLAPSTPSPHGHASALQRQREAPHPLLLWRARPAAARCVPGAAAACGRGAHVPSRGRPTPGGQRVRHACRSALTLARLHVQQGTRDEGALATGLRRGWPGCRAAALASGRQHDWEPGRAGCAPSSKPAAPPGCPAEGNHHLQGPRCLAHGLRHVRMRCLYRGGPQPPGCRPCGRPHAAQRGPVEHAAFTASLPWAPTPHTTPVPSPVPARLPRRSQAAQGRVQPWGRATSPCRRSRPPGT